MGITKRKWEEQELKILERTFPTKGAAGTQRKLEEKGYRRTRQAIMQKACSILLYRDPPEGYVTVNSMITGGRGDGYYQVLFTALQEGVLHDTKGPFRRYFVPEEWALNYLEVPKDQRT